MEPDVFDGVMNPVLSPRYAGMGDPFAGYGSFMIPESHSSIMGTTTTNNNSSSSMMMDSTNMHYKMMEPIMMMEAYPAYSGDSLFQHGFLMQSGEPEAMIADLAQPVPLTAISASSLTSTSTSNLNSSSSSSTAPSSEQASSCHHCKRRRPIHELKPCHREYASKSGTSRRGCRKRYCVSCLTKYGISSQQADSDSWACMACQGKCECAACRRKENPKDEKGTDK